MKIFSYPFLCAGLIMLLSFSGCSGSQNNIQKDKAVSTTQPEAETSNQDLQTDKKDNVIDQKEIESLLVKETKLRYKEFFDTTREGPVVPGLLEDLVPQGLSYFKEKNWLVISSYKTSKKASTLSIIDAETGVHVKTVNIYNADGTPYTGHASGVTISKSYAWVSSGSSRYNGAGCMFYQIKLEDLINSKDNENIKFYKSYKTGTLASFIQYDNGIIWVGDYVSPGGNQPDESHRIKNRDNVEHMGWVAGYKLDGNTDSIPENFIPDSWGAIIPDYILSITEKIQGMEFSDRKIFLSQSPGQDAMSGSLLLEYENCTLDEPHKIITIMDKSIPLWFLDGKNLAGKLLMPPMSEGITLRDNELYIVFESGAVKYRYTGNNAVDRIYMRSLK